MRSVSAFMPESKSISVTLRIKNNENKFYTHNSKLVTPGFRIVDEIDEDRKVTEKFDFSVIREGDKFTAKSIESKEAEKAPPARFNEASLVKVLESEGVGRPSTYFAMVHKPVEANYAYLQNKAYHMNKLGTEVVTGLEKFFPDIITPVFTKDLEEHLDKIEDGDAD
jgi:DNA topoisomerase-1